MDRVEISERIRGADGRYKSKEIALFSDDPSLSMAGYSASGMYMGGGVMRRGPGFGYGPAAKRAVSGYSDYAQQGYLRAAGVPQYADQFYDDSMQAGMHSISQQFTGRVSNVFAGTSTYGVAYANQFNLNQNAAFLCLTNGMIQGAAYNQRIGDRIQMQSLLINLTVDSQGAEAHLRMVVFVDRQPNGTIILPADFFENNAGDVIDPTQYVNDIFKWQTRNRIVPLLDVDVTPPQVEDAGAGFSGGKIAVSYNIPIPSSVQLCSFLASTTGLIADVETNAYYVLFVSDRAAAATAPAITATSRLMYQA